jgi:predicted GH43/DUF377 family glycosyl hydrolase
MIKKVKKGRNYSYHTELEFENGVLNPAVYRGSLFLQFMYFIVQFACNFSTTIGYAKLKGPLEVVDRIKKSPLIVPSSTIDKQGVEDARIVKKETFYMKAIS